MTPEDLLTRTFTQVTEATDYPATPIATVVARSTALRRRRRRRTALLAAVVVLVGGSAAVWLNHDASTTASPSTHLDPAVMLPDVPQGGPPEVAYLEGDTFVTATGDRISSPTFRTASNATTFGDGVLVAGRARAARPFVTISLVSGGSTLRLGCGTPSFALGADDPTYWLSDGCRLVGPGRLFQGTASTDTAIGAILYPVRATSAGVVANINTLARHPVPHVVPGAAGPFVTDANGESHRIRHLNAVAAVSPSGALATGITPFGGSVVVEPSTGALQWRATAWALGHFSASGRYVVGTQSLGDQTVLGVGDVIGIWDASTGRQVRSTVLPNMTIVGGPAWEGDDAVLVVAEDRHHQQAIVRIGLDGSITRATAVAPEGEGTFRLAATP